MKQKIKYLTKFWGPGLSQMINWITCQTLQFTWFYYTPNLLEVSFYYIEHFLLDLTKRSGP